MNRRLLVPFGLTSLLQVLTGCSSTDVAPEASDGSVDEKKQSDADESTVEASSDARAIMSDERGSESDAPMDAVAALPDAGPDVDPSADVRTLTGAALAELCDWANLTKGGYGKVTRCIGGDTVMNDVDQMTCMAIGFHPRCKVTVAQYQTCVLGQLPSMGCDFPQEACHPIVCQ